MRPTPTKNPHRIPEKCPCMQQAKNKNRTVKLAPGIINWVTKSDKNGDTKIGTVTRPMKRTEDPIYKKD